MFFIYYIVPAGCDERDALAQGNLMTASVAAATQYVQGVTAPNVKDRSGLEVILQDGQGNEIFRCPIKAVPEAAPGLDGGGFVPIKPQGAGGGWLAPNPEAPYRPHCYPPFWVYLGRGLNAGYWLKQRSVMIAVLPGGSSLSRSMHRVFRAFHRRSHQERRDPV